MKKEEEVTWDDVIPTSVEEFLTILTQSAFDLDRLQEENTNYGNSKSLQNLNNNEFRKPRGKKNSGGKKIPKTAQKVIVKA